MPASALAAPANTTDAAWAAYEVALAAQEANEQAYDAFEATVPIGPRPNFTDFESVEECRALNEQWQRERAALPANPFNLDDDALDALCDPRSAAEDAIRTTPAATFTDIERKLAIISNWEGAHMIEAESVDGILADVRRLNGTHMAG